MAQRRPISTHPAFVPLLALWFAALFGLVVAVLPAQQLGRALAAAGGDALVPVTAASRAIASSAAAFVGALAGLAIAIPLGRRGRSDPRPVYAEPEPAADTAPFQEPIRRPLRVREELADQEAVVANGEPVYDSWEAAAVTIEDEGAANAVHTSDAAVVVEPAMAQGDDGFMILTPQPVHPPRPAPDLDSLLEQFDHALAAFRSGDDTTPDRAATGADPVHAFVARQTGAPSLSPLGGRMPDHQAELRAALDKLAKAQRKD